MTFADRSLMAVGLAALLGLAGCSRETPQQPAAAPQKPIAVSVAEATDTELPATYEATGTVRARVIETISAKRMAYVREVRAAAGDHVSEAQTLVTLDTREVETAVRAAEAAREEVRSAIPEADAAIAAAQANADLAQATFRRMQDLYGKKSISNQEFDEATARRKAAAAGLDMARAKRAQLDAKLSQTGEQIRAAQIGREDSEIKAPFSGTVTAKNVEPGTLATPGAPLFTIERDGGFRLDASVEEARLSGIRAGQTVAVQLADFGLRLAGKVSEVAPSVDPVSREGIVKIDLPPSNGLRSGLFGRALFPTAAERAVTVPSSAIQTKGELQSVFVIENGIARNRLITAGSRSGDRTEILSGLSAGERVAAPVSPDLTDGASVEVRP